MKELREGITRFAAELLNQGLRLRRALGEIRGKVGPEDEFVSRDDPRFKNQPWPDER